MRFQSIACLPLVAAVAGCAVIDAADITRFQEPELKVVHETGPPNARPGACWGKQVKPAVLETTTDQMIVTPAKYDDTGKQIAPAEFETVTTSKVVVERQEVWFETPCPEVFTTEFVESLQRALQARKLYWGPVNGRMDKRTLRGVRKFQAAEGLDSPILSLVAARRLGLVETPIEELGG